MKIFLITEWMLGCLIMFNCVDRLKDVSKCPLRGCFDCCDSGSSCDSLMCDAFFNFTLYLSHANIPDTKIHHHDISDNLNKCSSKARTIINNICSNPVDFVNGGFSLYLYGTTGVGKTTIGIKILLNYLYHKCLSVVPENECRGMLVPADELIEYHRLHKNDPDFTDNIQIVKDCDLVVFDNLFATDYSKYGHEIIDNVLRYRILHEKSNIYTSNLSMEDAYASNQMLASLCNERSKLIEIKGTDKRRNSLADFDKLFGGDQ